MECLWEETPRTVMQIVNRLKEETGWAKSTITTLVSRMEAKGLLYYKDGRKAREYYPAITRNEAAISETESLLSRVYRGSVGMMMNTLVEKKPLTKNEIEELYAILQKAEEASE
ncbi:transcriptional regulator [Cohnella abietis]|uniref:Transcriptional regulator n=2 Tax=Cohnella abietis TaxID=2507935 RepID=A0A3T1CYT6_9BACL|nr:transcriptional regulator [Cohnella abietis]